MSLPIILEEIETGVEEGCNPSPWAPCNFPEKKNYRKEYTIKRTYNSSDSCNPDEDVKK
jgi:hypothetical protein